MGLFLAETVIQSGFTPQAAQAELDRLQGAGLEPQEGCDLIRLSLGDAYVLVEYEYTAGCEDEPRELNILGALVNGRMIEVDVLAPAVLDRWAEAIEAHIGERNERDKADMAIAQEDA